MTNQYLPTNINAPRGSKTFVAPTPPALISLNLDDDLVVVDTSIDIAGLELPDATQIPGWTVVFKATNAGTTGNSVTVLPLAGSGQTIDGSLFFVMTIDEESLTLKSDGSNWRIVGATGASTGSSISLDLTYDPGAPASEPPVLFSTWLEIIAAVAAIPPTYGGATYKTIYRLNIEEFTGIPDGLWDLNNAEMRSNRQFGPDGIGTNFPFGFPPPAGIFENVRSIEGIEGFGINIVSRFSWPSTDGEPFVTLKDTEWSQPGDGPAGPPWLSFPFGGTLTTRGYNFFDAFSIACGGGFLDIITMNIYERTFIGTSAFSGTGSVILNIFSPDSEISFSQGSIGGFFDVNIGGGETDAVTEYTLGETIMFSCGGPVDFAATGDAARQELYAGGTNPAGASPPQFPAFSTPTQGAFLPKATYLRGIGISIPTTGPTGATFDIQILDGFGIPVVEEIGFSTLSSSNFLSFDFGRANFNINPAAGRLKCLIRPTSVVVPGELPDGIIVTVRGA